VKLLVDLGNTRLKLARLHHGQVEPIATWAHGADDAGARLEAALAGASAVDSIWIADVARAEAGADLLAACARRLPAARVERLVTPARGYGVTNAYAEPARLGIDRWLGLVAAHPHGAGAKLVAGLGTALTIDALDGEGLHLGGLIAPSPELMQSALIGATGRVRVNEPGRIGMFGASTEDGLASGCWQAGAALVERAWHALAHRVGSDPSLILTGGAAPAIAALLSIPHRHLPLLVLEGLARYAAAEPGPG
jgi:type III pantothenate kinase